MNNPASTDDLELRGYPTPDDATVLVAETRLDEAWRALQIEVPSLVTRLTSGDLDSASAVDVIVAAALRVLRNPEGLAKENFAVDDYTESNELADATLDLYFTAAETRRLSPATAAAYTAGSMKYS